MPAYCVVLGCGSSLRKDKNLSFYRIPSALSNFCHQLSLIRREAWIQVLNRGNMGEKFFKNARVCSIHFMTGQPAKLEDVDHPDWIPTIGLPNTPTEPLDLESKLQKYMHLLREKSKEEFRPVKIPVNHSLIVCCINTCVHSSINSKCEWIRMPRDDKLKKRWIQQIGKYGDDFPKNSLICTCHFENDDDRIRGPTIFYANNEVSYSNVKKVKKEGADIEQKPHSEKVQVSDFVNAPQPKRIIIEESSDAILIRMLNSTAEQMCTTLNINADQTDLKLYNFNNICRICLKKDANRNIYEDHIDNIYIVDMIQQVTCSQITKADKLPELICTKCIQQVFYAYKFLTKFIASNNKLIDYIKYCENQIAMLISLKQTINFDHCYDSFPNPQQSDPIYVAHDLSDDEMPETDPLALETPAISSYTPLMPEMDPLALETPSICAVLPEAPATNLNIPLTPETDPPSTVAVSIEAPATSSYTPLRSETDTLALETSSIAAVSIEAPTTNSYIPLIPAGFVNYYRDMINVDTTVDGENVSGNVESITNKTNTSKSTEKEEYLNSRHIGNIVMSAEDNKTVESFKSVLKDTSDIDDDVKVDIIDTLIKLYSLKSPETIKNWDSKMILSCTQCNEIFNNSQEQERHNCSNPILQNIKIIYTNPERRDQIESFQCRICSDNFSNVTVLVSHECFVKFTRKRSRSDNKPLEKQFTCLECRKKFDYYSELVNHRVELSHSDPVVPNEPPCDTSAATETNEISLAIHSVESPHVVLATATFSLPSEEPLKHKCPKCEQCFEFFSQLVQHNRACKPPPVVVCRICSLEMKRAKYNEHMKLHTNERRYCCEFCGRSFKFGRHFKRHMEIHQDIKPHECYDCGRKFRQKSALKTHSFIHTGEKPFMCDGCGQKFRQRGMLSFHLKTKPCGKNLDVQKEGVFKYVCSACPKKFASKSQLVVHLKSHVYI